MSLRFWPEGYLLIPFALSIAALPLVGEAETSRRWNWCCAAIVGVLCVSHIPGIASRIHRSQQPYSTLDGFAEFSRRFPDDGRIVAFLRSLPSSPKVVLAEACGVGDSRVPLHFAWPGRLSAFSGRPGVCGWTRHAMLYNNPLERKGFKGTSVEEASATFLRSYKGFFESCAASDLQNARVALLAMKSFGVSHIAFGQFERELIPSFRIEKLPATLPVSIEFQTSDGLGILKINE